MLSEAAQASIDADNARKRDMWAGKRPLMDSRYGVRTVGLVAEVQPGMEVWCGEDGRKDWHEEPLGGIVLHVEAGAPATVDEETGEIVSHPARFRCYDPLVQGRAAFRWVGEDEICRDTIAVASPQSLELAVRRFCREVGSPPGSASGRRRMWTGVSAHEAQLVTAAGRLVAVLMGGTRHV